MDKYELILGTLEKSFFFLPPPKYVYYWPYTLYLSIL